MKRLNVLVLSAFILGLIVCPLSYAQKSGKMGYVDLSRLFDEYYKTKEYDKVLEQKNKDAEKEANSRLEKIRDSESKLSVMKEQEKAKLSGDVEKMKNDLIEFQKQMRTDLTKERNEKIREILLEIEKVVSDYAQKENFDIIFNDRVLIYGDKTLDLTEQILKTLNEAKPAEAKK